MMTQASIPRRVLLVDHTASLGGGEIALLNLVGQFDRTRYVPVVLLFSDGPLRQRLIDAGVEVHLLLLAPEVINARKDSLGGKSLLRLKDVLTTAGFAWRLSRMIRRLNVALVHTNSLKADLIAGVAARFAGKPLIWHVRDRIEPDYLPAKVVKAFRLASRVLPHRVIAISEATAAPLRQGSDKPAIVTIHDGTLPRDNPPRAIPPEQARIGLVGRISPWKGQHVFIESAGAVLQRFPTSKFLIIGASLFSETDYETKIRSLVHEHGLESAVEFCGFQADVAKAIEDLDVLVHASTMGEPFGQVVIEGMSAARPVIATRGGGVTEIVVDGESGLLVPMNDAPALAEATIKLLSDPPATLRMAIAGRQRVQSQFLISHVVDRVMALYDDILE